LYFQAYGGDTRIYSYDFQTNVYKMVFKGPWAQMLGITQDDNLIFKGTNEIMVYDEIKGLQIVSSPDFCRPQFGTQVLVYDENTWIANFDSEGLYRSSDRGTSWTSINYGLGNKVSMSLQMTKGGRLFVGAFTFAFWGGLYYSDIPYIKWNRVNARDYYHYFNEVSILKDGGLIASGGNGIYIADKEGMNWNHVETVGLVYSLYVSKKGTVFIGHDYKGIWRSTNNGWTWGEANDGISHSYFFGFGESESGRVFAAAWPSGSYYTDNEGLNWRRITDQRLDGTRANQFTSSKGITYAATESGLLSSLDNGISWQIVQNASGNIQRIFIAANGDILLSNWGLGILRRSNTGDTWETVNEGLGNWYVRDFSVDREYNVLAATNSGVFKNSSYSLLGERTPFKNTFSAFPNPSHSQISIYYNFPSVESGEIVLFDLLGRTIFKEKIRNVQTGITVWNTRALGISTGVYFSAIFGEDGRLITKVSKIIFTK
jgi:hypothetical protein